MGQCAIFDCCLNFELDATDTTLGELKRRLEGPARLVNQEPEVYVTIEELAMKEGGAVTFSRQKFALHGLEFHVNIEVRGTPADFAKLAAGKAMDKVGMEKQKDAIRGLKKDVKGALMASPAGDLLGKAKQVVDRAKDKFDIGTHKVKMVCVVDMCKAFGEDDVKVTVKDFKTDRKIINKVLSSDRARHFIEEAISIKVGEILTSKQNEVKQKIGVQSAVPESNSNEVHKNLQEVVKEKLRGVQNAAESGGNEVQKKFQEVGNAVGRGGQEVRQRLSGGSSQGSKE